MNWIQLLIAFALGAFFGPLLLAKIGARKQAPSY